VPLLGTPVDAIDLARTAAVSAPSCGSSTSPPALRHRALGRGGRVIAGGRLPAAGAPSYVLAPAAMEILFTRRGSGANTSTCTSRPTRSTAAARPFPENAIEVDVDALGDGESVHVAGSCSHVEEAGVHSGDSACVIPPMSLGEEMLDEIRATTERSPRPRRRRPLEHPVRDRRRQAPRDRGQPAASRTVRSYSKATGVPLARSRAADAGGEAANRTSRGLPSTSA